MQKFLILPIFLSIFLLATILIFVNKTKPEGIVNLVIFSFFAFLFLSVLLSIGIYFGRDLKRQILKRFSPKILEGRDIQTLKQNYRRSLKMAILISGFISLILLLKLSGLLTIINLILAIAVVISFALYFRFAKEEK
ncbi:MAG TPA: hypothetical protein VIK81_01010 [Patescibacteria group bacterium]